MTSFSKLWPDWRLGGVEEEDLAAAPIETFDDAMAACMYLSEVSGDMPADVADALYEYLIKSKEVQV